MAIHLSTSVLVLTLALGFSSELHAQTRDHAKDEHIVGAPRPAGCHGPTRVCRRRSVH